MMIKHTLFIISVMIVPTLSIDGFANQSNRYSSMAESMFDMMDAFSSAFQKRKGSRDNSWLERQSDYSSWLRGAPSWGSPGMPWNPAPMMSPWSPGGFGGWADPRQFAPHSVPPLYNWSSAWPRPGPLDGEWEDPAGNILAVANGRFRISQSYDRYSEGYISIESDRILLLRTRDSNIERYYEFAHQNGKLVLRDSTGNLLLFRRIDY
jgi:hypothetical protein